MAQFEIAPVFTDKCVLQRNKKVFIWGTGEDEKTVSVSIKGQNVSTKVKDGKWKCFLEPMEASDGNELIVKSGEDEICLKDVSFGEVWLAGGQSNMEFELRNSIGGKEMMENDHPNVRFFYTPKYEYEAPKYEHMFKEAHWADFDDEWKGAWSAVGYCFAKNLSEKLGVTVGVIGCNWGGTSASAWMREEDLREDEELKIYFKEYDENVRGRSFEDQEKEYEEYLAYRSDWEEKCNKEYADNPDIEWDDVIAKIGEPRYPGPINACNPMRPAGIYYTMLRKVIPYTMAGVIFYQGESDEHLPHLYDRLYEKMINRWRSDNGDEELPFIGVSLPMHRYKQDPDFKNWPLIRANQRKACRDLSNVGLAVCTDQGEFNEIHPKDKREVGRRLYLQALWLVYSGLDEEEANGPQFSAVVFKNGYAEVHFKNGGGLSLKGEELTGFELADSTRISEQAAASDDSALDDAEICITAFDARIQKDDIQYFTAKAEIVDDYTVKVWADEVENPDSVRFLWTNYADATLYGKNGICAEPFSIKAD